jgi:Fusaric acid resistance protein-like
MNDRSPEIASRHSVASRWPPPLFGLDLRRGTLALITMGTPIVAGLLSGKTEAGLVGCITGLLLTLSDTEGALWPRLGTTAGVALGIAVGGGLGAWLATVQPVFWIVFFTGIFAAGLLNQAGKGPHFAVRFGAIAFAVTAGLPELAPMAIWFYAGAVALSLLTKLVDQLVNGPLPPGAPWPGAMAAGRSHWLRFALAYALAASAGLWIGVQSGSVRAVWTAAIVLVIMLPDLRVTYARIFEGVVGTVLAVVSVWVVTLFGHDPAWLAGVILVLAFLLPSQLPRFWLFSGMVAVIVLLAWDLASLDPTLEPALLWERLIDTLIAAGLVTAITLLFFPKESWSALTAYLGGKRKGLQ